MNLDPLFEPLEVGPLTLRNRFVMPGMQREWCIDGAPTARLVEYYRRRGKAGTALIISEACAIDHPTSTQSTQYAWLTEQTKDAWTRCVDAVRGEGAEFFIQLWHEGAIRTVGGDGPLAEHPTVSPSGLITPHHENGRALTSDELDDLEAAYVRSAKLAREIGASGVEVHAAHGYLLDQFLWEHTNRRDDGHGGDDIRDRLRFPMRVIAAVREAIGPDMAISVRFSQWKEADYKARIANTPEELKIVVEGFESAGADMIHASTRRFWTPEWPELDADLGLAGWVKRYATVPVAAVGSLGLSTDVMTSLEGRPAVQTGRPAFEELLRRFERGDFDLMTVGRAQIADPDWVAKVRRGAIEELQTYDEAVAGRELEELAAIA
jgi:2,4-dienoyl-CoA reductase-like NADH-dependent reductase (Old Yellow Enzyme family)